MAGLGGPCGRMKRKKIRHSEIAALVMMRRVIWRFAMAIVGLLESWSPSVRSREDLRLVNREYSRR